MHLTKAKNYDNIMHMSDEQMTFTQKMEFYHKDMEKDCEVDSITLMDKLEDHPKVMNKWLRYLYDGRVMLDLLERRRGDVFDECKLELETGDDPRYQNMSNASMKRKIESFSKIKQLDKAIKQQTLLCEQLVEYVGMAKYTILQCCQSIIEVRKLEEM